MESENGGLRSHCGGPVLEPTTQELQRADRVVLSTPSAASPRSGEGLTAPGLLDDATEWLAEGSDQSGGGAATAAGRGGETRTARFRQCNVQLRADTWAMVDELQQQSGLARSHFLSLALLVGASHVVQQLGVRLQVR
jgi:hypothetical protein